MTAVLEFDFQDRHFAAICDLVYRHAGIQINANKREMVYGRLRKRLRSLGLPTFDVYLDTLMQGESDELMDFINALTTNYTSFFREPHHFEYLTEVFVEALARRQRQFRVWSAGCSTGQEPYSIAMTLRDAMKSGAAASMDVKILATDIDSNVLAKARAGVYSVEGMSEEELKRIRPHVDYGAGAREGQFRIKDTARSLITFNHLNLMHSWPMKHPFDVIFCRNVVIYFDTPTKNRLVQEFAQRLHRHGRLFMGHSESLNGVSCVKGVGRTAYALT